MFASCLMTLNGLGQVVMFGWWLGLLLFGLFCLWGFFGGKGSGERADGAGSKGRDCVFFLLREELSIPWRPCVLYDLYQAWVLICPKLYTTIGFFIHHPSSIPAITNTVTNTFTAVQRHWLCSPFSVKSSSVGESSAVLMEKQIINFLSWNPIILQAWTHRAVLPLHCPQCPLPTCSIAIEPCQICTHSACYHFSQERQWVPNLPSADINSRSYCPWCKWK